MQCLDLFVQPWMSVPTAATAFFFQVVVALLPFREDLEDAGSGVAAISVHSWDFQASLSDAAEVNRGSR